MTKNILIGLALLTGMTIPAAARRHSRRPMRITSCCKAWA